VKKILFLTLYLIINLNSFASTFQTVIHVGKGETREFTVTGLYEPFHYSMTCTVRIPDFCKPPLNPPIGKYGEYVLSGYIINSTINGRTSSIQKDYKCDHNQCYPGHPGTCALDPNARLYDIGFSDITNGSTFRFTTRPEFPMEFNCSIK
jgi:hypothetical protein